jgi:hypothetical protein
MPVPSKLVRVSATGALALGACGIIGQAFVSSGVAGAKTASPQALRGGVIDATEAVQPLAPTKASYGAKSAACGGALALLGLGQLAVGEKRGQRAPKVVRNFFDFGSSGSSVKPFDPATELGVQDPLGFWDPLGFCADGDEAAFKRRRSVEIKHGRICMLASIGYIVPEYFKFPGFISPSQGIQFADVPNGLAALSKVPALGWVQIAFFTGLIEGLFGFDDYKNGTPGEYGWKVITSDDPEEKAKKLSAELANGRLAMVSIIGMFFQDGLTGSAWGDWALYTASPLRAAEAAPPPPPFDPAKQIGAMAPLGYFDPAGFSKVGDEEGFRNLRSAEIKHARVAMMAALGGVVQHYVKFPGFDKVPAGLGAVTTAPGTYGFVALFLLSGALELAVWTQDPKKEPGNFGDPLGLGMYDEDMRNKEINNGRFAMFAALGIVSADLLTGKDAMQQFGM